LLTALIVQNGSSCLEKLIDPECGMVRRDYPLNYDAPSDALGAAADAAMTRSAGRRWPVYMIDRDIRIIESTQQHCLYQRHTAHSGSRSAAQPYFIAPI